MKIFVILYIVISAVYCARLDNTYLPPAHASNSGGPGLLRPLNQGFGGNQQQPKRAFKNNGPTAQPFFQQGRNQYQPQQSQSGPPIPILKFINNPNYGDGSYNFEYETGNGISHQEEGHYNPQGPELGEQVVKGEYSYIGDDGQKISVKYTADSNGFHAEGDHLPTPPPIPDEIAESLKLTAPGYNPYTSSSSFDDARPSNFFRNKPNSNQGNFQQKPFSGNHGNFRQSPGSSTQYSGGFNSHTQQSAFSGRPAPKNSYLPPNR